MKTFRMIGMALVAVVFGFAMSSCDNEENEAVVDPYKDYPQLIVGKWFNFTPEASVFLNYQEDGTFNMVGYDNKLGWMEYGATYRLEGDKIFLTRPDEVGESKIELTENRLVFKASDGLDETVHYRVKEQFDITGKYAYLNSVVRVVPAEGKTALQLPEGVTFNGQNSISIDAMHGDRIIDVMKKFFADATFAADGKLNHTMDGETKVKNYTLNGNNLTFDLYEGG